jgi:hypothetical protein
MKIALWLDFRPIVDILSRTSPLTRTRSNSEQLGKTFQFLASASPCANRLRPTPTDLAAGRTRQQRHQTQSWPDQQRDGLLRRPRHHLKSLQLYPFRHLSLASHTETPSGKTLGELGRRTFTATPRRKPSEDAKSSGSWAESHAPDQYLCSSSSVECLVRVGAAISTRVYNHLPYTLAADSSSLRSEPFAVPTLTLLKPTGTI